MKRLALPFVLALLYIPAFAQTTYNITGGPYRDGYYPPFLDVFAIQLDGTGNSIGNVTGSLNHEWGCGNGNPSQGGFIGYTIDGLGQSCANSTSYTVSGTVTIDFPTKPYTCSGPAMGVETFDDNSTLTVYWTYVHGGRWHNVCEGQVIAGSLVTNP